ncbi:hypothetical protein [Hymenobacter rubidus]|uniref:hypothetical protein n=1 Tax=Hymenobacter rubidus TaxID=1441626 RepID=UPI00191D87A7|nr:hypothetical protein [Hymenobacter rubidus]
MKSLFCFLLLLSPATLFAQDGGEDFKPALLQTKTGAILVYNGTRHAFTVRVVGKNVVPPTEKAPNFITVDGQILQATTIAYGSNGDVTDLPEETMKKFLISYQQHESGYFKNELKVPVANEKTAFTHPGNHLFMAWEFDTPFRGKGKVVKQLYMVSICYNQALVLNCPIMKATEVPQAKALLAATAASLMLKDEPVDLTELYHQLEKE